MARKTYHGKVGVKFKAPYTTSKNKSMLRNVVTDLIIHGRVEVTLSTAKELAPLADEMVTLAKRGDLHARRQAAEVVRKIFDMYASGNGYHKICEYLNNNNIPPRSVYKKQKGSKFVCSNCDLKNVRWNTDTIAQVLRNEVYIGNLVQGKKTSMGYKVHKFKNW